MSDDERVAWLIRQIEDDERVARAVMAAGRPLEGDRYLSWTVANRTVGNRAGNVVAYGVENAADREHIARWDPARVLAECTAKRRIVESESQALVPRDDLPPELTPTSTTHWHDGVVEVHFGPHVEAMSTATFHERFMRPAPPSKVLRLLAQPYRDRPGFRQEWAQ